MLSNNLKALYNKVKNFYNKYSTIIKIIFVCAVLILVIHELTGVLSEINGNQMRQSFSTQSPMSLGIMLVLGLVAVLPMLIYDFTIVEFLPGKFKPSYIVKSGWITNSFTNIAGFGGFLGAGLRAHFYKDNASRKQILYSISKIALFLLAGLSTYCILSLILILFGVDHSSIGHWPWYYWLLLIGGGIYFPAIFVFTRLNDSEFFSDLTLKREVKLILGSCLEWGSCAALFLIIGASMGVRMNFLDIFPLFVMANIAGVVSLIPGGLGSFDAMMIIELSAMGVPKSTAVVWLLLYRAFYYIIPFLIGIILFVHDSGKRINQSLDGIPMTIIKKTAQIILTIFMYFSGFMMLLLATVPNIALVNKFYLSLEPYTFYFLGQLTNIIVAFILIALARGIGSKVKRAFWPTTIILIISMANSLWQENFPIVMSITFAIILLCLWLSKDVLYRKRLSYSWGQIIMDVLIFIGTFVTYSVIGFYLHSKYELSHLSNSYLFPSEHNWLIGFIGLIVASLILVLIYRYFSYQKIDWLDQPFNEKRVQNVINDFGGNEVSHLAYVRDKQIYFYSEDGKDQVFFMFKRKANKIIIMGEPVGNKEKISAAIDQFMLDADEIGLSLVFYEVGESFIMMLHEKGFEFTKFGEEGFVDLNQFTLVGRKHRGERALMHKFERNNYQFEVINPPFDSQTIQALKNVSDQWLDGNQEKGFSLGYFNDYYLNKAPIAIIKNEKGDIVSFATMMPVHNNGMTSIDLMRSSSDAPSGIMDGVFINLFKKAQSKEYQSFNLGMAPLSNVGVSRFSFIDERISNLIYQYGYNFYSFQGLRSYKDKYVTSWRPRYIAYRRKNSLVFTMLQLLLVVNERIGANKKPKKFKLFRK